MGLCGGDAFREGVGMLHQGWRCDRFDGCQLVLVMVRTLGSFVSIIWSRRLFKTFPQKHGQGATWRIKDLQGKLPGPKG